MNDNPPGLRVDLIAKQNVPMVLTLVGNQLKAAVEMANGEMTFPQMMDRLLSGHAQLWICAEKGGRIVLVGVTRVVPYPNIKRLAIDVVVGKDLLECYPFLEHVEVWASKFGCTQTEAYARPGMAKLMRARGWKSAYEVILKPISQRMH